MTPKKEEQHREKTFQEREQIIEMFNTITMSLTKQVQVIIRNLPKQQPEEDYSSLLQRFEQSNYYYSHLFRDLLLRGLFLAVYQHDLQLVAESFEAVMSKIEQIAHRSHLLPLPEWIIKQHTEMVSHLQDMLLHISSWFNSSREVNLVDDLSQIHKIENTADQIHHLFLKRLYQEKDLSPQVFRQAEFLDLTIEDCLETTEQLAYRIYVVLYQYRSSSQPSPTYLS